jgi:2'-5' RNA ligase
VTRPTPKPAPKRGPQASAAVKPQSQNKNQTRLDRPARIETPAPEPSLRLFYALTLPRDISTPLAETQSLLKGNWRAVRADQMHVTLAYLPAVPPERLGDLRKLGADLTQNVSTLDVRLRGTGYFPNEGSPRVWFVKVEAEGLAELAANLREGIAALGLATDEQPFKAHITLARKKGPAPRVPPKTFDLGWQASSAVLARSILRKTGPLYQTESTFRFRAGAAEPEMLATELPTPDAPDQPAEF